MTSLLRGLKANAADIPFQVSFETTHHGPFLKKPTLFIEIGSDKTNWENQRAAQVIAKTLLGVEVNEYPIAIGIGGGHYAPRFTEVALSKKISFGHLFPNYAMEGMTEERFTVDDRGRGERELGHPSLCTQEIDAQGKGEPHQGDRRVLRPESGRERRPGSDPNGLVQFRTADRALVPVRLDPWAPHFGHFVPLPSGSPAA